MNISRGSRLGPYEIVAPLGAGGMGEVYRATDTRLKRDVAIKVLPAAFTADRERVMRFEREAQILAQLRHPNIAPIFGLEESDGVLALVMELVEGPTLAERLAAEALPVEECLSIARQIAAALEEAHEKGIVHRDLKPLNVKAPAGGEVKVLDFGLAKAMDPQASGATSASALAASPTMTHGATQAGMILGTAAYMAPEQARGLAVDRRADIWAFGVVLYEMLTGRQPFAGETVSDTLAAVLRQEVDWSLLPKEVSDADRRLIRRCLERDPRNRLRDIGEARIALEDPAGRLPPPAASTRTGGARAVLGATVLAAIGFAAGFGVATLTRGPGAATAAGDSIRVRPITSSGNVIAAAVSPDGSYVAYVESGQGLQSLWLQQLASGQTLRLVADENVFYWGHTFTPDGNSIVFGQKTPGDIRGGAFSISTLGGAPRRLLSDIDSAVSYSPDGRRMTFLRQHHPTSEESSLMVANADGSGAAVLATFKLPEFAAGIFFGGPAWSPDGRSIATAVGRLGSADLGRRARLVLVSVADGTVSTLADPGWVFAAQAGWMPDGKSLLVIARSDDQANAQIWAVTVPGGQVRTVTADLNDHRIISLTRDGRSLVSVASVMQASLWTVPLRGGGKPRRTNGSTTDGFNGIAFSAAGQLVYTSHVGGVWSLWRAGADGADRSPFVAAGAGESLNYPSIADDGTVYFVARSSTGNEIRAVAADGSSSRVVTRDVTPMPAEIARDGSSLVFGALVKGTSRIFRSGADGAGRTLLLDENASLPAVDAAGKRVAFYRTDAAGKTSVGIVSIEGGPLLASFPAETPTSDSRLLLTDDGVYLNTMPGDRANVWLVPTGSGPPRRVTAFEDQVVYSFAISRDGSMLAVSRGPRLRDAQLITGFDTSPPR